MRSSLPGIEARHADAVAAAVRGELRSYGIDESRVELTGHPEPEGGVLSIAIVVDGAASRPLPIETDNFRTSLGAQMDVLRAWLRAGHPAQVVLVEGVQYKAGDRVPVPDVAKPMVAVRDSQSNRVWVVSERDAQDPAAEPVPYLIFPDGSLIREHQHGLPD